MWLVISGMTMSLQTPVNLIVVGILAVIFGFWISKMWQGWLTGLLGIWIFLSGVLFDLLATGNFIIVGIVMSICGIWAGWGHTKGIRAHTS
jgi:hypothetical protein